VDGESWIRSTLRKRAVLVAALLGLGLAMGAALAGLQSFWGVLLLGAGSSILATAAYTALSEFREGFMEALLDQGLVDLFPSRLRRFEEQFWPELIERTRRDFRVLGVANHGYITTEEARQSTRAALLSAIERGVTVEIVWLNPEHSLAEAREREEGRTTRRDIVDSMNWFWELRQTLGDPKKPRFRLREHEVIPSCGLTWADDQLIATHYIAGQTNLDSPGMILATSGLGPLRPLGRRLRSLPHRAALAQAYMNTYNEVSAGSRALTQGRVDHLVGRRAEWDTGGPSESQIRAQELGNP
jgi:hypothetical protein